MYLGRLPISLVSPASRVVTLGGRLYVNTTTTWYRIFQWRGWYLAVPVAYPNPFVKRV